MKPFRFISILIRNERAHKLEVNRLQGSTRGNNFAGRRFTHLSEQAYAGMPMITAADQLSVPEAELIRLSLQGDSQAFSELVKPYRPMFSKKALSIVRNESDGHVDEARI